MDMLRTRPVVLLVLMLVAVAGCRTSEANKPSTANASVLMVCEHGSVKSLMAASLFNQGAAERHLPFRAIARGVTPDHSVPAPIAAALGREGFDVQNFVPTRFSRADVTSASRVVVIGVEPAILSPEADVAIETWHDVPAASENYSAAHASLKRHVDALLTELEQTRTQ